MAASRRRYTSVTCASVLVLHLHQRRRKARDFRGFGDNQRNRLAVEHDFVVIERPERRAQRSHIVLVGLVVVGHGWPVRVRQHLDHTFDALRRGRVNAPDAAFRDGRGDDAAVEEAWNVELGGIFCGACNFCNAVDAGRGRADVCHGYAQMIFLDDCDCGVPCAACVSVRTMQRRARPILKVLCA